MPVPGYRLVDGEWVAEEGSPPVQDAPSPMGLSSGQEAAVSMAANAGLFPVSGLANLAGTLLPGPEHQGRKWGEAVQDWAYQPRDNSFMEGVAETLEPVTEPIGRASNYLRGVSDEHVGLGAYDAALATLEGAASAYGAGPVLRGASKIGAPITRESMGAPITRLADRLEIDGSRKTSTVASRVAEAVSGQKNPARRMAAEPIPDGPDPRNAQGMLYPEEYNAIADEIFPDGGARMLPGQERLLTGVGDEAHAQALEMLRNENLLSRSPNNIGLQRVYDRQRAIPGIMIKRELGIPDAKMMTDEILGDNANALGKQFDHWATEVVGNTPIDEGILGAIDKIADTQVGIGAGRVRTVARDIRKKVEDSGGILSGEDWAEMRKTLTDIRGGANRSNAEGMNRSLGEIQELLTDALEDAAPAIEKTAIANARKNWALSENLLAPGVISKVDRSINVNALYNSMFKGQRGKRIRRNRRGNDLARQLETMSNMGTPVIGTSGSAEGVLKSAAELTKKAGKKAAAAGAGLL